MTPPKSVAESSSECSWMLALALLTLLLFSRSLFAGFVFDDDTLIIGYQSPESWGEVWRSSLDLYFPGLPYFRPLSKFTIEAQRLLFGLDAPAFHAFNIVCAMVLAPSVYFLLRRLGLGQAGSCLGAAIATWHPSNSSLVYAISGREALLANIFCVLSLAWATRTGFSAGLLEIVFLICAVASRESALGVIPGLLVAHWVVLRPVPEERRRWILRTLALLAVVGCYLLIRHQVVSQVKQPFLVGSAILPVFSILYAFRVLVFPSLRLEYQPSVSDLLEGPDMLLGLVGATFLGLVFASRKVDLTGAQNILILILFGCLFLPTANLLWQETPFDERHAAVLLIPVAILCGRIFEDLHRSRFRTAAGILGAGALIILGTITALRTGAFESDESFTLAWLEHAPASPYALQQFSLMKALDRDYPAAEASLKKAIQIQPVDMLWIDLALLQADSERFAEARTSCLEAEKIFPASLESQLCLAQVSLLEGDASSSSLLTAQNDIYLQGLAGAYGNRVGNRERLRTELAKEIERLSGSRMTIPSKLRKVRLSRVLVTLRGLGITVP